jgi:DNA-binding HxlR family transcriptional regulator
MKRTSVSHMNCSVARTLDIVGEWWTLLVVRNLMFGQRRFEEIQGDLGIARNILSDRLNTLVEAGVVDRVKYMDHPERYEYTLSEKGRDLFQVIAVLMAWGDKWASPGGPPMVFRHSCGHLGEARVVCSECGEPMEYGNVRAKAGPGFTRT